MKHLSLLSALLLCSSSLWLHAQKGPAALPGVYQTVAPKDYSVMEEAGSLTLLKNKEATLLWGTKINGLEFKFFGKWAFAHDTLVIIFTKSQNIREINAAEKPTIEKMTNPLTRTYTWDGKNVITPAGINIQKLQYIRDQK